MKKLLNLKNIAIVVLAIIFRIQYCNPGVIPGGKKIYIEGKSYEVIKHTIDTFEIEKEKIVTKKGKDIVHEVIEHDTTIKLIDVDTAALLKDYLAKVIYQDTLTLPDSLGFIAVTDTIHKNRIEGRTFNAKVKERLVKETLIVKEPAKAQLYYGFNGGFNKEDVVANIGAGIIYKTKRDKLYQLGLGITNKVVEGNTGKLSPYIGAGVYWKIKAKK